MTYSPDTEWERRHAHMREASAREISVRPHVRNGHLVRAHVRRKYIVTWKSPSGMLNVDATSKPDERDWLVRDAKSKGATMVRVDEVDEAE